MMNCIGLTGRQRAHRNSISFRIDVRGLCPCHALSVYRVRMSPPTCIIYSIHPFPHPPSLLFPSLSLALQNPRMPTSSSQRLVMALDIALLFAPLHSSPRFNTSASLLSPSLHLSFPFTSLSQLPPFRCVPPTPPACLSCSCSQVLRMFGST